MPVSFLQYWLNSYLSDAETDTFGSVRSIIHLARDCHLISVFISLNINMKQCMFMSVFHWNRNIDLINMKIFKCHENSLKQVVYGENIWMLHKIRLHNHCSKIITVIQHKLYGYHERLKIRQNFQDIWHLNPSKSIKFQ